MPRIRAISESLLELLNTSSRPVYAIDGSRRIVYCNAALAAWLELVPSRIAGRTVEYHSEHVAGGDGIADTDAPLADLCPPPRALSGVRCSGTISCAILGGRLAHRHAEFLPLPTSSERRGKTRHEIGVLVMLADRDLTAEQLSAEISVDSTGDELHRVIRRFRRSQAATYRLESILGNSAAMHKVRAQVSAAAVSGANVVICGRPGAGRGHIARAIHYHATGDTQARLIPVDCAMATDETLRRAVDALRSPDDDPRHRPTLLLENLERLSEERQASLLTVIRHNSFRARTIATCSDQKSAARMHHAETMVQAADDKQRDLAVIQSPDKPTSTLRDFLSTITVHVPRLCERLQDLPLLAQCMLERCNRASEMQVGAFHSEALDRLALYSWPGELTELREVVTAAHEVCQSHEITCGDLPVVIHHASQAASRRVKQPERVVLDELLAAIEREAIMRALATAGGNKTEAADLLGMTRPRLYRRLVQLGLVSELKAAEEQGPEFIERVDDEAS